MNRFIPLFFLLVSFTIQAQDHSAARDWSEVLLEGIRNDFARPTVHARNLYHVSMGMYDAWAVYDTTEIAETVLLGNTLHGVSCPIDSFPIPADIEAAREEAICYAAYRLMLHRFANSPGAQLVKLLADNLMAEKGYSISISSTDYQSGVAASMGNYIAQCIIDYGLSDQSNEENGYINQYYQPVNPPLVMAFTGNPDIEDHNRWQPLTLDIFIDQSGNPIPFNTPPFLSPEWGSVFPFAMKQEDLNIYQRSGDEYWVYHDPGPPPYQNVNNPHSLTDEYRWGFELVSKWSSHLDAQDTTLWDISPASIGNIALEDYPTDVAGLRDFYDEHNGGDIGQGHALNPHTGLEYDAQLIKRGDYGRVLAEFWADGPASETPPGHWFTILNYVMDHPEFDRRFNGAGDTLNTLEYDVKAYLTLGGAVHDAAVAVWGIKGWYDYIRPVSAIRALCDLGQRTDPMMLNYHPAGINLDSNFIELVLIDDPLVGANFENLGKIKLRAWRGPDYINDPETDEAGVDWVLGENWWPYQRPTFVTPNFAGYISGHSTFSRAAAEVLTMLTGDAYFPGGMGVFEAPQNEFLVFEEGPSQTIELQWATYRDASDQCSLSRIWGGIHPPADDIPGRLIGRDIGIDAFEHAQELFYNDEDGDGVYAYADCDDNNASVYPGAPELCDDLDNNCDGNINEGLEIFTYYFDFDEDGFGIPEISIDTCLTEPPFEYADNFLDCVDDDYLFNPDAPDICDGLDNNCNGFVDEFLTVYTYYLDFDEDGFGDANFRLDTCIMPAPMGYVTDSTDCDDLNIAINPMAIDTANNGIDEDCNGEDLFSAINDPGITGIKIFPNPFNDLLQIAIETNDQYQLKIYSAIGNLIKQQRVQGSKDILDVSELQAGVYFLNLQADSGEMGTWKLVKN